MKARKLRLPLLLALALAAAAGAACTDFDDLPRGACGNGLVEPGEDCDSTAIGCVRCAVACAAASDCPNADYACGVDGFCHAPGGALDRPSAPVTFQVDDLRVADLDHDGTGDVLGVSKTSVVVRYGDATGALAASDSFVTPAQSGPPSFGDLDGDGSLDLTLATLDGIVSFASRHGTLAPLAIEAPIYGQDGRPLDFARLFAVGPQQLGAFFLDDNDLVVLAVVDFLQPNRPFFAAPCAARLGAIPRARFARPSIDIYQASAAGAAVAQYVVSFLTATGEPCVMAIHGSPGVDYILGDVTPTGAAALQQPPRLVDLDSDGDPCPSLVSSDNGAQLRRWDGAMQSGRCALSPGGPTGLALPPTPGAPASAVVIGRAPLVPPIFGVGSDALVMSSGVYVVGAGAMGTVYASSRRLGHVAHGDLDGDGDLDVILGSADEDDLDILYRYPLGVEVLRIDTASRVTSITVGDYDGNTVNDIAYTESVLGHQDLRIAYGTSDRPLPPVQVASFSDVASVALLELGDSVDTLNIADDLVVIQPGTAGELATLSLLHGSPQRTMLSFFDPRPGGLASQVVLRGAVVGRFAAGSQPDLLALATQPAGGVRAWTVAGTARGLDNAPNSGVLAPGLADCDRAPGTGVCVQDATYLAWPVAADRDVVIAVDRPAGGGAPAARVIDPWASSSSLATLDAAPLVAGLPAGVVPRSLHAADVDGDGAPELIAAFATRPGAGGLAGSVRVCTVAGGAPERCDELLPVVQAVSPGVIACIDAAPGRFSARDAATTPLSAADVVVLCRDPGAAASLFRISFDGGPRAALLAQGVDLRAIRIGDVTGDGVDDVVALQGDRGSSSLLVYRQCTSRDAAGCRAAQAAPGGAP